MKADLVKELLVSHGIQAELRHGEGSDFVSVISETSGGTVVTVPASSLAAAQKVVKSAHEDGRLLKEWMLKFPHENPES
jgi:hypothetical protein